MRAIPALDLRDGACVQLVGGSYADEAVRITDPVGVASRWKAAGFRDLHIVDLDAAVGVGANTALVEEIVRVSGMQCQVGGGVRSASAIRALLDAGAMRVILGTRALEDPQWLSAMSEEFPYRIVVAADTRGREVVTRGWQNGSGISIIDVTRSLDELPLAGILVTAVHKEGRMTGPDLELMRDVVQATRLAVQASGGITTPDDMNALQDLGISAAVLGMSLYTGALDPVLTSTEFCS